MSRRLTHRRTLLSSHCLGASRWSPVACPRVRRHESIRFRRCGRNSRIRGWKSASFRTPGARGRDCRRSAKRRGRCCPSTPVTVPSSKPAARSASWCIAPLEPKESLYVEYEGDGRYKFVYYLQTQDGQAHADLPGHDEPVGGRHRHDEGRSDVRRRADAVARGGAGRDARVSRPRGHGHAGGRHRAPRRHQLPDAVRMGHGLHADPQHDRAAGRADAGRSRRNRLVRARDRVPLRAAGGRGHYRRAQHPDRSGLLRAARADHDAACTARN